MAALVLGLFADAISMFTGSGGSSSKFYYKRPGGTFYYKRPGGTFKYIRP